MVYVGMDVHRKRTQVAILDEGGAELVNRNVANDPAELLAILGNVEPGSPVAFEAAYGWGWLKELLDELGLQAHLAHPLACKAIASARLKNDKVDARTLAHLLRADLLPEAWIAPPEVQQLRALLRHRSTLVRRRGSSMARIHGLLADRGASYPGGNLWTEAGRSWLGSLELRPIDKTILEDNLELIDFVSQRIARLETEIRGRAGRDERVEALCRLPGIGTLTAMMLVAEIGDISRFSSARKLCAWAGLTPAIRNSDRKVRHGHITKQGSKWVRWSLIEAAHVAKTRPPLERSFVAIAQRRGRKIATVAIARKLLGRCYHVLTELEG